MTFVLFEYTSDMAIVLICVFTIVMLIKLGRRFDSRMGEIDRRIEELDAMLAETKACLVETGEHLAEIKMKMPVIRMAYDRLVDIAKTY